MHEMTLTKFCTFRIHFPKWINVTNQWKIMDWNSAMYFPQKFHQCQHFMYHTFRIFFLKWVYVSLRILFPKCLFFWRCWSRSCDPYWVQEKKFVKDVCRFFSCRHLSLLYALLVLWVDNLNGFNDPHIMLRLVL